MNILYITNLNYLNKAGLYNATINRALKLNNNNDIHIEVVNLTFKDSFIKRLLRKVLSKKDIEYPEFNYEQNLKIKNVYATRGIINTIVPRLFYKKSEEYYINYLKENFSKDSFDIIHAHWVYPHGFIAKRISDDFEIPYVVTAHGTDINKLNNCELDIKVKTITTLNNANRVFFVSSALREKAEEFGYKNNNSFICYNGVDLSTINSFYGNVSYGEKLNKRVGFIGNLEEVKGVEYLIKIFKEIDNINKCDYYVIGDGSRRSELEVEAKGYDLNVNFLGKLLFKDVIKYLYSFDVLVLPSKNEGFPCVLIEANACGVYTIASDVGGVREAIGKVGSVIELNNEFIENVAKEINNILEDGYDKEKLKMYANEFDWDKIARNELKQYKEILDNYN